MCETRPKRKTRSPFRLCYFVCLDKEDGWGVGGFAQGKSGGVWFKTTPCGPLSLWQSGPADGNVGRGYAGPGIVRKLRSCEERRKPEGGGGTGSLLPWKLVPHT